METTYKKKKDKSFVSLLVAKYTEQSGKFFYCITRHNHKNQEQYPQGKD